MIGHAWRDRPLPSHRLTWLLFCSWFWFWLLLLFCCHWFWLLLLLLFCCHWFWLLLLLLLFCCHWFWLLLLLFMLLLLLGFHWLASLRHWLLGSCQSRHCGLLLFHWFWLLSWFRQLPWASRHWLGCHWPFWSRHWLGCWQRPFLWSAWWR